MLLSTGGTIISAPANVAGGQGVKTILQAHLGNNMAAKTFVAGNANTVYDTIGTGNWKFYAAATTSVAAITSASASSEWTGGSLLSYPVPPVDYAFYFPFETADVVSSTVLDRVTGLYSGTIVNGSTITNDTGNARVSGQGYLETIKNSYFRFSPKSITIASGISIAFWLRIASSPTHSLILDIRGSNNVFAIESQNPGLKITRTGYTQNITIPFAHDGSWHHMAVTMEYISGTTCTYRTYKDGIIQNTFNGTPITYWNDSGTIFNLAAFLNNTNNSGESFYVNGSYDDLKIYNRVITELEVSSLFSSSAQLKSDTGAAWNIKPETPVDASETGLYTVKSNEIALTPGTNSTYAVWTAPKTTNIKIDVSFADYHTRSTGVGFQMFKVNNDDTFGSTLFNRTVTSLALINGTSNYLTVPSMNLSVIAGDKVVYRIDGNGNPTSASSVLATTIYADQQTYDFTQKIYQQANLANNLAATTFVVGNSNVITDTIGTGNWNFYVAGSNSIAAITSSSNSSEWTGGNLLSANESFAVTLNNGATYAADAGSRVAGKKYLKLTVPSSYKQFASILPFIPTTNGISFSFWIKISNITNAFIFNFRDANNVNQTLMGLFPNNPNFLGISNNLGEPDYTNISFAMIGDGIWHHIVWTMTYSATQTSTWKVYFDKTLNTTLTSKSYINILTRKYHNIGTYDNDRDDFGYALNAGIDNFKIHYKTLSDTEVIADYDDNFGVSELSYSVNPSPIWKLKPSTPVDTTETLYTVKSNEIALTPGANSTYAVWTASKPSNIRLDVSFADYHTRNVGVGFQMFNIKSNNTFGSVLFNRTVTGNAITDATLTNGTSSYLTVPPMNLSVASGDKIYIRVDNNGNPTSASSVLAATIYTDSVSLAKNANETKLLQASLGNNLAATTFVVGNANSVYDTIGTGNWKFYAAATTSVAAITSSSASSEWTGGSLLGGNESFDGTLVRATFAADANSRNPGKPYLQLVNPTGTTTANWQYVNLPAFPIPATGFSFAFWFWIDPTTTHIGYDSIIDFRSGDTISTIVAFNLSPERVLQYQTGGEFYISPYTMPTNTWVHIAVTVDPTATAKAILYINGGPTNTPAGSKYTLIITYPPTGTRTSYNIGTFNNSGDSGFSLQGTSRIDNFKMFTKVLSEAEVLTEKLRTPTNISKITPSSALTTPAWNIKPGTLVDTSETGLYTVKSNEIALIPGANSTYAIWTAPKSTNIHIDVSFADYHTRNAGVGFQMFKINNNDTFGSTLFNRTVTGNAITDATLTNGTSSYLPVPSINLSVTAGDKVVYRIDGNGNPTSASSVLATNIYSYTGPWS